MIKRFPVTAALIALMAPLVLLAGYWGEGFNGVSYSAALYRMGAVFTERVHAGEWWRMLSGTLLHGGLMHGAMNLFMVWMLGRQLEFLLGAPRYILLYLLSALGGSVGTLLFSTGFSVGASGALWGLMMAFTVLAFWPGNLIPPQAIPQLRKQMTQLMILNVGISFLPGIDLYAHFAGGLAGALVMLTPLGRPRRPAPPLNGPAAVLAGGLWLLLPVSLGLALMTGRPWSMNAEPDFTQITLSPTPVTLTLPDEPYTLKHTAMAEQHRFDLHGPAQGWSLEMSVRPLPEGQAVETAARWLDADRRTRRPISAPPPEGGAPASLGLAPAVHGFAGGISVSYVHDGRRYVRLELQVGLMAEAWGRAWLQKLEDQLREATEGTLKRIQSPATANPLLKPLPDRP